MNIPAVFYHCFTEAELSAFGKTDLGAARDMLDYCRKSDIDIVTYGDDDYPKYLREIPTPPVCLFVKGKLPDTAASPSITIVGTRECSERGKKLTAKMAYDLSSQGFCIVSGMARGIDSIAQRAALEQGGKTFAVLGCGVDVCYPASGRQLYEKILETGGGILSTFPPGMQPLKKMFPQRNRIVAGLSDVLLVVEARHRSGTLITVDMALEQGKNVYAVPGRLTDRLSDGCNLLIRQGAGIALTPEDILAELAVLQNRREIGKPREKEKGLITILDFVPKTADQILTELRKTGREAELTEVLEGLMELCLEGKAMQIAGSFARTAK